MKPIRHMILLLALPLAGCGGPAELEPCELPGVEGPARCGVIEVAENRAADGGRTLGIRVVVLPATGEARAADAVTFLAGGGVVPATRYAGLLSRTLSDVRKTRDLLLVDQRGSGSSNPLDCDLPGETGPEREAALRACLQRLASRADPRFYTTPHAMDDLDEIRERLGYPQLTLWGVSYGTKAARVYLRRHPGRVRAAVLHGTVPLQSSMWLDLPKAEAAALDKLLDRCAADPACSGAYPAIREEYAELLGELRARPVETGSETIDDLRLQRLLYGSLRSMRMAGSLPAVIHRAASGDLSDFEGGPGREGPPPVPRGVYLSIACSEELARIPTDKLERAEATMPEAGRRWLARERADCAVWPRGEIPDRFWEPVRSEVPVLLLAGAEDYLTPPAYAERAAAALSDATVVVAPERSHDDLDPCLGAIIQAFLIAGHARGLDTSCLDRTPPLRFVTGASEPPR